MSATLDDTRLDEASAETQVADGSLASRIAARRAKLQANSDKVFDVPGYEGILAARYRVLGWTEMRGIGKRHERMEDEALQELYVAADNLILACDDVLEVKPDGTRESLNLRWGTALADRLGVTVPENVPGSRERQALLAIIARDTWVITHYGEVAMWQESATEDVDETVVADLGGTASSD